MVDIGLSKDALRALIPLSGEFVGTTDTQTITTKTINTSDNTITATSQAAGDILINNATKFVRLGIGTAGQPLKVNSGATTVEYGTLPVAGGGTGLATATAGVVVSPGGTTAFSTKTNPVGAFLGDSDTQVVTGLKTFNDQRFAMRNPAGTFTGTWINPAITADRNLELQDYGHYLIYIAGATKKRMNLATHAVEDSNSDAATVIQGTIDALGNDSGKRILINDGFYSMTAALNFTAINGFCTIAGASGHGVTQLRPTTNVPIFDIVGAKQRINLENLYLTHNDAAYTNSLVKFSNGTVRNNVMHCTFYDFEHKVGNAIGFDSTTASIYLQFCFDLHIFGFENGIFANCGSASFFTNSNHFLKCNFWTSKRALKVTSVASAAFDDNTFELSQYQAYAGTLAAFDYDSSGRALYTKHTNVMVWDLPGATQYLLVNANTEMTMFGCFPSYKVGGSGATSGKIRAFDNYSMNRGKSTQSGTGAQTVFNIAHSLGAAPTHVNVTPGSTAASAAYVVTATSTNVVVTFAVAPASGTNNVILYWQANVF